MAHWSKEFLVEFADFYQHLECVWKVKSKYYGDEVKKYGVCEVLVTK
jgi:hypothetical protein